MNSTCDPNVDLAKCWRNCYSNYVIINEHYRPIWVLAQEAKAYNSSGNILFTQKKQKNKKF